MSFSNAVSTATNGAVTPTNATSVFSNAWDSAKGIVNKVNSFTNQIGQTIAPGADPMVQKAITNFGTNMVTTGGDLKASLENTAIGTGVNLASKEVTDLTSSTLGDTGSKIAGSTAGNITGALASGADPTQALISGVAGGAGAGVTNITGSPILGKTASTLTGSTLSGGDIGQSLVKLGTDTGLGYVNQQLGITPTSTLGKIVSPLENMAISSLMGNKPTSLTSFRPASLSSATVKKSPLSTPTLTSTLKSTPIGAKSIAGMSLPPQKVDVSTLKPFDISTLGLKV